MFASVPMRESIGGVAMTTATEMMMVASTRGDLDLNDAPPPAYEYPVMEGLKHAMIQHEMVFKNQVAFGLVDISDRMNPLLFFLLFVI